MDASVFSVTLSPDATATVHRSPDRTLVTVVGELDQCATAACEVLVDLVTGGGAPVHVDLGGVTFFSAAGITWLVRLYGRAGGGVRVMAASGPVRELLRVCGMPTTSGAGAPQRHAVAD